MNEKKTVANQKYIYKPNPRVKKVTFIIPSSGEDLINSIIKRYFMRSYYFIILMDGDSHNIPKTFQLPKVGMSYKKLCFFKEEIIHRSIKSNIT
jgi:hypothetical protein